MSATIDFKDTTPDSYKGEVFGIDVMPFADSRADIYTNNAHTLGKQGYSGVIVQPLEIDQAAATTDDVVERVQLVLPVDAVNIRSITAIDSNEVAIEFVEEVEATQETHIKKDGKVKVIAIAVGGTTFAVSAALAGAYFAKAHKRRYH